MAASVAHISPSWLAQLGDMQLFDGAADALILHPDPPPLYHDIDAIPQVSTFKKSLCSLGLETALRSCSTSPHNTVPPAYLDTLEDPPPDYTEDDALAHVPLHSPESVMNSSRNPYYDHPYQAPGRQSEQLYMPAAPYPPHIIYPDLSSTANIREHISKKKKQEQKRAQADKWADSDGESDGQRNGGQVNGNGGGGGAGGTGPGGVGGHGDDNDGGGDGDWQTGGGKKKGKKGKKGKAKDEEDEEDEEEEGQLRPNFTGNFWDNLEEANLDDDFTTVSDKKKKNKKNKVIESSQASAAVLC